MQHPRITQRLVGHTEQLRQFEDNYLAGRCHHAWLICGEQGIGKATFAYKVASKLLASYVVDQEKEHRLKLESLSHPDLKIVELDLEEGDKDIKVDKIRELNDFLRLTAVQSRNRVVVIDSVNDLNINAANALLKILEEPPVNTFFLIVCHALGSILPTIRSRCRILRMSKLSMSEFRQVIDMAMPNVVEHYEELYELSEGSMHNCQVFANVDKMDVYNKVESILSKVRNLNDITELAQIASDDGNWGVVKYSILRTMREIVKKAALNADGSLERKIEYLTYVESMLKDSEKFHIDKGHLVTSLFV